MPQLEHDLYHSVNIRACCCRSVRCKSMVDEFVLNNISAWRGREASNVIFPASMEIDENGLCFFFHPPSGARGIRVARSLSAVIFLGPKLGPTGSPFTPKTGLSCARSTKVLTAHNPKVGGSNPPPATNLSSSFQSLSFSPQNDFGPIGSKTQALPAVSICPRRVAKTATVFGHCVCVPIVVRASDCPSDRLNLAMPHALSDSDSTLIQTIFILNQRDEPVWCLQTVCRSRTIRSLQGMFPVNQL